VRLFCGFTHTHELVIECCYLYCYAVKQLIVHNLSKIEAYEKMKIESERRAKVSSFSTVKFWIESNIDMEDEAEMPFPHYRPTSFIKIPIMWAFYFLKNDYQFDEAIRHIIKKGGET
jgi:ADP-ribosylglycohydrolase